LAKGDNTEATSGDQKSEYKVNFIFRVVK